jgi:hypothetical protein
MATAMATEMGMPTHRRCVAQSYDEHHIKLAEHFIPKMAKWCSDHGWDHVVREVRSTDHDHDHNYRKYPLVRELLPNYHEVIWADTDIIPVSGEAIEVPHGDIHFSIDRHGICAGFVIYRSNQWVSDFVSGLLSIIPRNGRHHTHEQDTIKLISLAGDCGYHIRTIPESVVANPCTPKTGRPPVFFHAWSNAGVDEAIRTSREACNSTKEY